MSRRWETIQAAAARVGRSEGRVRALVASGLVPRGMRRRERQTPSGRVAWMIRSDWQPPAQGVHTPGDLGRVSAERTRRVGRFVETPQGGIRSAFDEGSNGS